MYRFLDLVDNCRCANHRFPPLYLILASQVSFLLPDSGLLRNKTITRLPDDYLIYLILACSETTRLPDYLIT